MLVPLERPNFSIRFAEEVENPQELESILRKLVGDVKTRIERNIKAAFNDATRNGIPDGYNNAYDYLVAAGWDAIESSYNEAVRKGLIKDSVFNRRLRDKIGYKYSQFIGAKVNPIYKKLQ